MSGRLRQILVTTARVVVALVVLAGGLVAGGSVPKRIGPPQTDTGTQIDVIWPQVAAEQVREELSEALTRELDRYAEVEAVHDSVRVGHASLIVTHEASWRDELIERVIDACMRGACARGASVEAVRPLGSRWEPDMLIEVTGSEAERAARPIAAALQRYGPIEQVISSPYRTRRYELHVDPEVMRAHDVTTEELVGAVVRGGTGWSASSATETTDGEENLVALVSGPVQGRYETPEQVLSVPVGDHAVEAFVSDAEWRTGPVARPRRSGEEMMLLQVLVRPDVDELVVASTIPNILRQLEASTDGVDLEVLWSRYADKPGLVSWIGLVAVAVVVLMSLSGLWLGWRMGLLVGALTGLSGAVSAIGLAVTGQTVGVTMLSAVVLGIAIAAVRWVEVSEPHRYPYLAWMPTAMMMIASGACLVWGETPVMRESAVGLLAGVGGGVVASWVVGVSTLRQAFRPQPWFGGAVRVPLLRRVTRAVRAVVDRERVAIVVTGVLAAVMVLSVTWLSQGRSGPLTSSDELPRESVEASIEAMQRHGPVLEMGDDRLHGVPMPPGRSWRVIMGSDRRKARIDPEDMNVHAWTGGVAVGVPRPERNAQVLTLRPDADDRATGLLLRASTVGVVSGLVRGAPLVLRVAGAEFGSLPYRTDTGALRPFGEVVALREVDEAREAHEGDETHNNDKMREVSDE